MFEFFAIIVYIGIYGLWCYLTAKPEALGEPTAWDLRERSLYSDGRVSAEYHTCWQGTIQTYSTTDSTEVQILLGVGWQVQSHTQPNPWSSRREEWILSGSGDPWEIIHGWHRDSWTRKTVGQECIASLQRFYGEDYEEAKERASATIGAMKSWDHSLSDEEAVERLKEYPSLGDC